MTNLVALGAASCALGGIGTMGGLKLASKITGKPMGLPGSTAHVLTNDKLDKEAKKEVLKECTKEGFKDIAKMTGVAGAAAGAAAIATGCSNKASAVAKKAFAGAEKLLSKVSVNGKSLKTMVKNSNLYKNFNKLPMPAKAAIAAGAAVLAFAAPILGLSAQSKSGYIEGKYEA